MASPYFIYSTAAGQHASDTVAVLDTGPMNDFVSMLSGQVIKLQTKPDTTNPISVFDPSDALAQWFTKLDLTGAVTLSLNFDATTATKVESFTCQITSPWALTFTSTIDALSTALNKTPVIGGGTDTNALISVPGIDKTTKALCMAYMPNAAISTTVLDIMSKFIGFDTARIACFPDLLQKSPVGLDLTDVNGNRNLLWFNPAQDSNTAIRLQLKLNNVDALNADMTAKLGSAFTVDSARIVCKKTFAKTVTTSASDDPDSFIFDVECSINSTKGKLELDASIGYDKDGIRISLVMNEDRVTKAGATSDPLSILTSWLTGLVSNFDADLIHGRLNKDQGQNPLFSNIHLRSTSILLNNTSGHVEIENFKIAVEIETTFGQSDPAKPVVFKVDYEWNKADAGLGTLVGPLWNDVNTSATRFLESTYETWTDLQPLKGQDVAKIFDLIRLLPGDIIQDIPEDVQTNFENIQIEISDTTIAFHAPITFPKNQTASVPMPTLKSVDLSAIYTPQSNTLNLQLLLSAELKPSILSKHQTAATLTGAITYSSGAGGKSWKLNATAANLYASTLCEFFESDSTDHVMPLIDSILIKTLTVSYDYVTKDSSNANVNPKPPTRSVASKFQISGTVNIASLVLNLNFVHTGNKNWNFKISLASATATHLEDIIQDVLGDDQLELPDFLAQTEFGGDSDKLEITVKQTTMPPPTPTKSTTPSQPADYFFRFLAVLQVSSVTLTFTQYHVSTWPKDTASKRLIKVAISELPQVDVPLVGQLLQPFDEMYYMWVQDLPRKDPKYTPGITRRELLAVNAMLADVEKDLPSVKAIVFKEKLKEAEQKPIDIVVGAGSHFCVIEHNSMGVRSCILDYDFMQRTTKPKNDNAGGNALVPSPAPATSDSDAGAAHAPLNKKSGPLTISNIGLKYADKVLTVKFSAALELGPIAFELIGLAIGFGIENIKSASITIKSVGIEGLSAAFEKPPITIAGLIKHQKTDVLEYYAGGLIIGFVPYLFEAAGFYGVVNPGTNKEFKSIFIFARLDGPLVSLEFAEISGITGGFGYNSSVNMPTAAQVTDFPFVATNKLGDGKDALAVLEKITDPTDGWFAPLENTYWAAAGLKVDAFQMLAIDAVVVVQFGASVKLGIYAVAVADLPSSVSGSKGFKFAHVELGISVTIDFTYGLMSAEAQLAPSSFILHPDCHLTGGFALYYWFNAPHADQSLVGHFVFTIGGYHQAFEVPIGWPNPPRLGISWSLGSNLSITGEAYFAITPKACMGGGRLHAAFSAGPIEAWFDVFADFLINYQPFHFEASAGICIGVRFNIDVLFVHIHISVEINAGLELWGPPLAGRVHVDFWITSFNINFGEQNHRLDAIGLFDFYKLALSVNDQNNTTRTIPDQVGTTPRPENEGLKFLPVNGLMNDSTDAERKADDPWVVRSGTFSFVVQCSIAISNAAKGPDDSVSYTDKSIIAKPMQHTKPMDSTMTVNIAQTDEPGIDIPHWIAKPLIKSVPTGLWVDSHATSGNSSLSTANSTIPLMMGVQYTVPKATLSPDKLPIFNIERASIADLIAKQPFPDPAVESDQSWEPVPPVVDQETGKIEVKAEQWEVVRKTWAREVDADDAEKSKQNARINGDQEGFATAWAQVMGWTDQKLDEIATIPKRVNLRFADMFVAVPMLTT